MNPHDDQLEPTGPVGRTDPLDQLGPIPAAPARRPRRTRTARPAGAPPAGYTQAWSLFADWCAGTDHLAMPADPATVLAFLAACPAAAATQRRRVAAIDHHHTVAGHPAPGGRGEIRAAVGRPLREPVWVCPDRAAVDTALRALPSHGFTAGLFGQRDRALLVLAQIVGLPYRAIASLTAADLGHDPNTGTVTVTTAGGVRIVESDGDAALCPACALTRWLRTHTVMTRYVATQPLVNHLRAVDPVTDTAPHDCRHRLPAGAQPLALLPPVNQWGHVPFPHARLSPHALSRQTRALLVGHLPQHRDLVATTSAQAPVDAAVELPAAPPPRPYGAAERTAAWEQRRHDLRQLSGVAAGLDDVERRAAELDQRITELLTRCSLTGPR